MFFSMIFVVTSFYEATVAHLTGLQLVLVGTTVEATILLLRSHRRRCGCLFAASLDHYRLFIMGWAFIVEARSRLFCRSCWHKFCGVRVTPSPAALPRPGSRMRSAKKMPTAPFCASTSLTWPGRWSGCWLPSIGEYRRHLPIIAGGALVSGIAIVLARFMPEHGFHPARPEERNTCSTWVIYSKGTGRGACPPGFAGHPGRGADLRPLLEGWDRLWVKYLVDHFSPTEYLGMNEVAFFGLLRASGMILSILVTRVVEKRLDAGHAPSVARAMMGITALLSAAIFTFAFSPALAVSIAAGLAGEHHPQCDGPAL